MAFQIETPAVLSSLATANLLPSPLIPQAFKSSVQLSVAFNDKLVAAGNLLRASDCKVAPTVTFTAEVNANANTTYTLMLVDPDAPTPDDPKFAYWRHWVVSSIPNSGSSSDDAAKSGKTLTEYLGPGPKDESKPHRYMFLLYREPEGLKELTKEDVGGEEFVQRRSFGARKWVEKFGLELVGVNWMLGAGDGWKEEEGKSEL
ncbi:PEBP-like protein [Lentithecium fluviatile CBS 122367]|uniref:PEBP-like protein n=1 Tax=Lentithecium fluviatile CBS 122367 TaxID=1168545 RepID=A0A6G1IWH8_9PLEO|nr:PEBP-like protein [Lentithecium fluviatile CBS 122367]